MEPTVTDESRKERRGHIMGNVYKEDKQTLSELLTRATSNDGATLLIPDLQRPYVWTPNQVTLLIDSLIRGWPFGTLLLWKVNHDNLSSIPFRPFWKTIDRTDSSQGEPLPQMNPPATYHMVLDGQQRVQSLVLALAGDDWGFTLEDRDWIEALRDQRPRGRQPKHKHWSKGSLCFDLESFLREYTNTGSLAAVDFVKVLTWCVTDPNNGQSKFPKPENYEEPLIKAYMPNNRGRYVRLSRLWTAAQPNATWKEAHFRSHVEPLLKEHAVSPATITALLPPLGELLTTLRDVKVSEVAYLELQPFDRHTWSRDSYNDAVVNIFTRLNTAGRTLTREEITLAWLKVGWEPAKTQGMSADECFTDLQRNLKDDGLSLQMDELVGAVSFLWSVADNQGRLLENRDLLRGEIIRPMASALSARWPTVSRSVRDGLRMVNERGLEYGAGGQFASLNALAVLWAWLHLALTWQAEHKLSELQRDDFEKKCAATFASHVDRWLICSQWAGRWSESSNKALAAYARHLNEDQRALQGVRELDDAHGVLRDRLADMVRELEPDASNYVNGLSVNSRERVAAYRNVLWVWHRANAERWKMSQIPLRVGRSKRTRLEVDHAVAWAVWERRLGGTVPAGFADHDEALASINRLGNCSLLDKSFNISKSDRTLGAFLAEVHEFKEKKLDVKGWAVALGFSDAMLNPNSAQPEKVSRDIEDRDRSIRVDVGDFIKGQRARVDV